MTYILFTAFALNLGGQGPSSGSRVGTDPNGTIYLNMSGRTCRPAVVLHFKIKADFQRGKDFFCGQDLGGELRPGFEPPTPSTLLSYLL